jgi:hypothetical protein
MGKLDCLFSKPLQVTYIVKAAVPVQKSCKGNTVEKVLKRQHRDAQVAHKCVSPPPISHGGECLSVLFFIVLFFISALLPDVYGQILSQLFT